MNVSSRGITLELTLAGALAILNLPARADLFGTGPNTFTLDFVDIGNAGNTDDLGAGGGLYSSPYGGVAYEYRMGTYEISRDAIDKAIASGLTNVTAGAHTGAEPAASITWYEAVALVNWLNTSTGHQAAYNLNPTNTSLTLWSSANAWQLGGENLYRHKDAYYFLPSENEWYKAAYHKNDGVTANYWDYATGSNSVPDGIDFIGDPIFQAVFDQGNFNSRPNEVTNAGEGSPYGTFGQNGNVSEWLESAADGVNDSPSEDRLRAGGAWIYPDAFLRAFQAHPTFGDQFDIGFRVASVATVPEPSAAMLMIGSGLMWLARRRRGK